MISPFRHVGPHLSHTLRLSKAQKPLLLFSCTVTKFPRKATPPRFCTAYATAWVLETSTKAAQRPPLRHDPGIDTLITSCPSADNGARNSRTSPSSASSGRPPMKRDADDGMSYGHVRRGSAPREDLLCRSSRDEGVDEVSPRGGAAVALGSGSSREGADEGALGGGSFHASDALPEQYHGLLACGAAELVSSSDRFLRRGGPLGAGQFPIRCDGSMSRYRARRAVSFSRDRSSFSIPLSMGAVAGCEALSPCRSISKTSARPPEPSNPSSVSLASLPGAKATHSGRRAFTPIPAPKSTATRSPFVPAANDVTLPFFP
eukprot:Sspe_Gene.103984::Locus_79866_Transcript_1_1_Confidence_1.000_Length_1015::g.103984::m.103984